MKTRWAPAFTLVEMMIVVAIISLLAAVAFPRFSNMLGKSREAALRGKLGTVRSAISIYYADTEGVFPFDVGVALTSGGRYLSEMPVVQIPNYTGHAANNLVGTACSEWDCTDNLGAAYRYNPNHGHLAINCEHTDSTSRTWSTW